MININRDKNIAEIEGSGYELLKDVCYVLLSVIEELPTDDKEKVALVVCTHIYQILTGHKDSLVPQSEIKGE